MEVGDKVIVRRFETYYEAVVNEIPSLSIVRVLVNGGVGMTFCDYDVFPMNEKSLTKLLDEIKIDLDCITLKYDFIQDKIDSIRKK
jgi:hypothetical protein